MILPNNLPFLFPSPTAIDNFIENDMPFLKDQQNQVANLEAVMNLREKEFIDQANKNMVPKNEYDRVVCLLQRTQRELDRTQRALDDAHARMRVVASQLWSKAGGAVEEPPPPTPPEPEPEPAPEITSTPQNIQRGIEVVNGAAVGELELDISCVVLAMNEWSKNWSAKHRPNSAEVKKASVKLLELTGDRNSISNLPQYASILVALKVLDLSGCSGISGTFR